MNFRGVRENLLKMSVMDFSKEYEMSVNDVENMEKTNEVPISLVRQISKKSGISVASLLKYENGAEMPERNTDGLANNNTNPFQVFDKSTVLEAYKIWLNENKKSLELSDKENEWVEDNLVWILDEYEKSLRGETEDGEEPTLDKDVIDYMDQLLAMANTEIEKYQYVMENKGKCQTVIKEAVNLEATRLMKEDSIIERTTDELITIRDDFLQGIFSMFLDMTTVENLEKMLRSGVDYKDAFSTIYDSLVEAANKREEEFWDAIDDMVYREDSLISVYDAELGKLFAEAPKLNGFSAGSSYRFYLYQGLRNPEVFEIEKPSISDEELKSREKKADKRIRKESGGVALRTFLFPPAAIFEVATMNNKHRLAKELYKSIEDYKVREDVFDYVYYRFTVYVASVHFAHTCVKDEWKDYFQKTIDLVHKDDREIILLQNEERKKVLLANILKDAIKEAK